MIVPPHARKKCFIVEGNIGAGKSTLLRLIANIPEVQVIGEPHEKWQDVSGTGNLLQNFYQDTHRWAYTFQSYAFVTRVLEQEIAIKKAAKPVHVLERSVYSDRYCFAKNCYEMGTMNALEWKLYQEWFSWLVDTYVPRPDGFIYLRTDPEVCYERILKRKRAEESAVSIEYLSMIHRKHEDWLIGKHDISTAIAGVPVLVLECNKDFESNSQELASHLARINTFFALNLSIPGKGREYRTSL